MKKIIIPISALFVVGLSHAQTLNLSTNENYVYTKTYLTDPAGSSPKSMESVQYLDGLGRPKQAVNIKASPLGRDVVTHFVYDQYGRQAQDFLPVTQGGTANGAIVTNPTSNAVNTPLGNEIIFSKKEFEASPLDRVLEQKQVGTAWSNKPVKFGYEANENGEVKKYVATFDYASFNSIITLSPTPYGAGQLYKNTVTDEDGNKTIEFKNGQGQVLLVRKMLDATTEADTYYVYNDYNQLAYVIPPLAVAANAVDPVTLSNLCYQYKYDSRNRLVEKKLPGKGWEYMVYDKADRLIATQDANLRPDSKWLVTKYDKFGRVAYTGIMPLPGQTREGLQAITNNYVITENRSAQGFTMSGMQVYYTNGLYSQIETILSVNYYDTYPTGTPGFTPTLSGNTVITDDFTQNISTKSLPVASFVKNIEDDNWTKNYTWYDSKGRPLATHSINHLGGYTKTESLLDFSGTPQQVVTSHKRLNTDTERVITENFTYDHQNRLLTHTHQVDSNPMEYLAQNKYNELSQLESKKVGGVSLGNGLQQVDYLYNIRGWMTQINNPNDLSNGDLFGYEIKYNNPDNTGLSSGRYNGNIAEIDWKTATNPNDTKRRYSYMYDGLNRLQQGVYTEPGSSLVNNDHYNEFLTYDLNGNIATLKRFGKPSGGTTAEKIDDLIYNYTGNRLDQITLPPGELNNYLGYNAIGGSFAYDSNGNMKSHGDRAIGSIGYNHLSLPSSITTGFGIKKSQTNYLYRADGTKLRKSNGGAGLIAGVIIDYLDGFQYQFINDFIICIDCPAPANGPELQFVPTAEGYFDFVKNKYIYNYADHLGNTRLSYFHNGSSIEVLEENNYYPFGLKHEGYNGLAGNPSYQYKYNGKELQTETGMYDYGARFYMPDIGRWGVVDPLAEKMTRHSPYNYAFNNPIRFIDPDGRMAIENDDDIYKDRNGKEIYRVEKEGTDRTFVVKTTRSNSGSNQDQANINSISRKEANATETAIKQGNLQGDHMNNIVQIANADTQKAMLDYVSSKDDGLGTVVNTGTTAGFKADNFREHGGVINADGSVTPVESGAVVLPNNSSAKGSMNSPVDFHSHQSGQISMQNGSQLTTGGFQQSPSAYDASNAGNGIKYEFGMRSKEVYIYNTTGVVSIIPFKNFGK